MDAVRTGDKDGETISRRNSCFEIKDGVPISTFDLSTENFLAVMEAISELSGGTRGASFESSEIERFKSMVVFLREWKQFYFGEWMPFHYNSKTINFAYVTDSAEVKHAINGINLPHFSSAAVPKVEKLPCTASAPDNDDFVLHVGGSVWALDWCPRLHENTGCDAKVEYLAVSAHPTGSEYHKIGEQLSGRGAIQIWCFPYLGNNDDLPLSGVAHRRGRPRKTSLSILKASISSSNIMESPSAPFTIRGLESSNEHGVSSEFYNNEVPKNSYSAGDLDGSKETCRHTDNSVERPRVRGKPRKIPVSKKVGPRGRPRKHPISSSNDCAVICSGKLLDSSSISTSKDFGSLSGPITCIGCYLIESHTSVNNVSDLNGQEKALPICKFNSHSNVDGLDAPLDSLLPSGSGEIGSITLRLKQRQKKSSVPSENNIDALSKEDLLALPISRGCEASRGSAVTELAVEVKSRGSFNDGAYGMKSCLQGKKRGVKDGAIILYADTNQNVKINDGVVKEMCDGFSGGKLMTSKKNKLYCNRSLIPASPPFREVHDSEAHAMPIHDDCPENAAVTNESAPNEFFIPNVIALPRLVLSLAHNGKVAWDMKWRPSDAADSKGKHHMGYLAVLLGNGSLEVWEVPVHGIVSLLYAACHIKGTDPRFLKLQPVFRCSTVNFGDRQSIPLALEWSPSASRDLILAGCHDGTVALWKFSSQHSSQDTKPLLCFTADTAPIRSLAWAPNESDIECSNLIVTAGLEGLKFWDLRDPYRPLWDLCPVHRAVLGLDWLKDPRCIVIAYEDGTLRTLSLTRIANDMPVTGETLARAKQPGLHSQSCSSFAIWSVQVSRSIGLVAYCGSDGCTRCFQLTEKAVDKDASRYRKPHFTCGSLVEEGPAVIRINTHFTSTPLPKQTILSKKVVNEATPTNSAMLALCWHEDNTINFNSNHKKRKGNPKRVTETGEDEGTLQCIQDKADESRLNILKFPPKSVALHKVRWNMNKGSERWLCYGGAAGIVRCQVVSSK